MKLLRSVHKKAAQHRTGAARTSKNSSSTTFVNKAQKERRSPVGPRPLLIWLSRLGRATSAPPRLDRLGGQFSNKWGRSLYGETGLSLSSASRRRAEVQGR